MKTNPHIEKRKYYNRYYELWEKIKQRISSNNPESILIDVHQMIDDMHGYQYGWHSRAAEISLIYLLKKIGEEEK